MLARALAHPSNLLILDEPTNDLDLETLDLLQEMIAEYNGTVILVSHDRDFLDRTVTTIICAEGNGEWIEYAGGFSDMISQRSAALEQHAPPKKRSQASNKTKSDTQGKPSPSKGKLSYKDKHALETLPKTIKQLQADIDRLQTILNEPNLFTSNPEKFERAAEALNKAQSNFVDAEEKWLELEILREELEGA